MTTNKVDSDEKKGHAPQETRMTGIAEMEERKTPRMQYSLNVAVLYTCVHTVAPGPQYEHMYRVLPNRLPRCFGRKWKIYMWTFLSGVRTRMLGWREGTLRIRQSTPMNLWTVGSSTTTNSVLYTWAGLSLIPSSPKPGGLHPAGHTDRVYKTTSRKNDPVENETTMLIDTF